MPKIALIADIHNGPDMGTKKGTAAPGLLKEFVAWVNARKPDLVIELGDRVNHVDPETDAKSMEQVAEIFRQVEAPVAHIMGNHDVDYLTTEQNEKIMGCSFASHHARVGGVSFVHWNADSRLDCTDETTGFNLREEDFEWLEKTLAEVPYPAVISTHVPLDNGSMQGNFYFNKRAYPHRGNYPEEQGERLREIIERSGKVILCLNGHAHWNAYNCIDGVHYVTIPSLTELFVTYPDPHSAWAWMTFDDGIIDLEIFGKTPMRYKLPMRAETRHWISLYKDYTPVDIKPK